MTHLDNSLDTFLTQSRLYVLLDSIDFRHDQQAPKLVSLVQQLIDSNVSLIQLRDKMLSDHDVVAVGKIITQMTRQTNTRFIINDHPNLAVKAGADGVHLGQDDQGVAEAKLIFESELKIFGVSTHSIEQARIAVDAGADYIGVGPVFPSRTKSFKHHVGLDLVRSVAAEIMIPAFAIGGIDLTNLDQVIAAGIPRVAVSNSVVGAEAPFAAAQQFKSRLN